MPRFTKRTNSTYQSRLYICICLFLLNAFTATGQDCPQPSPAIAFIQALEQEHEVSFSYSNTLWQDMTICPPAEIPTLDAAIQVLNEQLPLHVKEAGKGIYILVPERSLAKIQISDAESGEPLPVAYITINNQSPGLYYAHGNYFHIPGLLPSDTVQLEASFYDPEIVAASALLQGVQNISLKSKIHDIDEVIVIPAYMTRGIDCKLNSPSVNIDLQQLASIAGETDGDIYQAVKALPGISSPSGKPGSIIIRGSLPDLNLVQFDNIPVYHIGHLYGAFSPFNPNVVRNVEVFRNSVPVEYGSRVGGMVKISSRDDLLDSLEAGVLSNFVYSGFDFSLPIECNKTALQVSARHSLPFLQESPKYSALSDLTNQGGIASPVLYTLPEHSITMDESFYDISAKLIYKPSPKNTISVSSILIDNKADMDIQHGSTGIHNDQEIAFGNKGLNASWNKAWNKKLNSELSVTTSKFEVYENVEQAIQGDTVFKITALNVNDFKLNGSVSYRFNKNHKLSGGYDYVSHEIINEHQASYLLTKNTRTEGIIQSGFMRYESIWGGKFIANLGMRGNYYKLANSVKPDFNAYFNYLLSNHFYLKASASQSHQYINVLLTTDFEDYNAFKQYWFLTPAGSDPMMGRQSMLGAVLKKGDWLFDTEFYYKHIQDVPYHDDNIRRERPMHPPTLREAQLNEQALQFLTSNSLRANASCSLITQGLDLLLKKKWNQADTWISYTLSQTNKVTDTDTDPIFYDRLHDFNVTTIVPYRRWTFSLNWNYATGLPVQPVNFKGDPELVDQINIPYEDRYPATHQLDLSITCQVLRRQKHVGGVLGLSLLNVYNQKNLVNNYVNMERIQDIYRYGIGFAPNLQLELRFK